MQQATSKAYDGWQDEDGRERILMEQLPQVKSIARRIHERLPRHVPLEDLVHAGVLGLMDALQKFDQGKHVQFSSYAKFRIRGAILDSLRELDWSPRELRRKARLLEETSLQLSAKLGRAPGEGEMAAELGLELSAFQHLLGEIKGLEIGSFHVESSHDGGDEDLCEYLPDDPDDTPYHRCLESEMKQMLSKVIGELPEKERQVMALYYYEELTMKEVGVALGVGESRVSQIHSMAIVRLRARMSELQTGKPTAAAAGRSSA